MTRALWGLALTLPAALGLAWAGLRVPVPVAAFQQSAFQETGSQGPGLSPAAPQVCQSGRSRQRGAVGHSRQSRRDFLEQRSASPPGLRPRYTEFHGLRDSRTGSGRRAERRSGRVFAAGNGGPSAPLLSASGERPGLAELRVSQRPVPPAGRPEPVLTGPELHAGRANSRRMKAGERRPLLSTLIGEFQACRVTTRRADQDPPSGACLRPRQSGRKMS